jgi:hypothetical protein
VWALTRRPDGLSRAQWRAVRRAARADARTADHGAGLCDLLATAPDLPDEDRAGPRVMGLPEGQCALWRRVTHRASGTAIKKILPRTGHRWHRGLSNRVENSHQPARRFTSVGPAQRFLERFGPIRKHGLPHRRRRSRSERRAVLASRVANWREATGVAA